MKHTISSILGYLGFCLLLAIFWSAVFGLVYIFRN
jgi:hypothetical protein